MFEQRHAPCRDGFLATHRADLFARLGLQPHSLHRQAQNAGNPLPDRLVRRREARSLGQHDTVEIDDPETGRDHLAMGDGKHLGRIPPAIFCFRVGEPLANVVQTGGAEDGVGYRVQQHVGVTVPNELPVVRHLDAAEPQRSARLEAVRVFADSDAKASRWDPPSATRRDILS